MLFYRLNGDDERWLDSQPETFMGVHLINRPGSDLLLILGGVVATQAIPDFSTRADMLLRQPWMRSAGGQPEGNRTEAFHRWRHQLQPLPGEPLSSGLVLHRSTFLALLAALATPPAPPPKPATPYGHLPFWNTVHSNDVFYRWEPWPTSRRVNQSTGVISAGTFAAPQSEAPFVPTGFSAVGRFALPALNPACFRWELRPPIRTTYRCGASVPLNGQAGGGVEVMFPKKFANVGPIANPVVLAPL